MKVFLWRKRFNGFVQVTFEERHTAKGTHVWRTMLVDFAGSSGDVGRIHQSQTLRLMTVDCWIH